MRTTRFRLDPGIKSVTAEDVVRAIRTLLGATGDLSDWTIRSMSLASPLVIDASSSVEIQKPLIQFVKKMDAIGHGKPTRGAFTGVQAKLLDSVDFVTANAFGSIEIKPSGTKATVINHDSVKLAREKTGQLLPSLMIHARQQVGQLRGYLEQITARHGRPPRFVIRDRVTGETVDCRVPEDSADLFEAAVRNMRKRVLVDGTISFGDRSRPTSIQATGIHPIEEFVIPFDRLPRVAITEDGNASQYVRRLRDA